MKRRAHALDARAWSTHAAGSAGGARPGRSPLPVAPARSSVGNRKPRPVDRLERRQERLQPVALEVLGGGRCRSRAAPSGPGLARLRAKARGRSTRWTTSHMSARSNQPSLNGSCSAGATLTVLTRSRATAAISGSGSTPQTRDPRSASAAATRPVPQPMSSTRRPSEVALADQELEERPPIVVGRPELVVAPRQPNRNQASSTSSSGSVSASIACWAASSDSSGTITF